MLAILAAGATLRIIGLSWGLPYGLHPDEGVVLERVEQMSWSSLNPRFFIYPGLFIYQAFAVHQLVTALGGDYEHVLLAARLLTALYSLAAVGIAYLLGVRLGGPRVGLIGTGLLAVMGAATLHAHYAVTDTPAATLATAVVWLSVRAWQRRSYRGLLVAAAVSGLAVSTKYSVAPACVVPWLGMLGLAAGDRLPLARRAALSFGLAAAAVGAFLITSPYTLLDAEGFARDLGVERRLQAEGRPGEHVAPLQDPSLAGRGLLINARAVVHDLGPAALGLAIGCLLLVGWRLPGTIRAARQVHEAGFREPLGPGTDAADQTQEAAGGAAGADPRFAWDSFGWALLIAWVLLYYAFMAPSAIGGQRYMLPLYPALMVMAAGGFELMIRRLSARIRPVALATQAAAMLVVVALPPAERAVTSTEALARRDTRLVARDWIVANLPAGTHLAREHYAPFFHSSDGFRVSQPFSLTEHPLATYCAEGVEYLLLSSLNRQRYFEDEDERFARERTWYAELESRTRVIERFEGREDLDLHHPTIEVRRLFCGRTATAVPARRSARSP